ncbi:MULTISPECIES: hypothetical protein [Symbiopectobacterium]|uniref:hypothetical protein n=1 Tax=Symbiopectobacterium TaxID=801 RepID=UPI001A1EF607|nr:MULTISPECIES: hypothetical protein [Symbiopectobacterium]MBG6247006.1 hypothetical protein [Candidatus Symbiopectobacterium sp. PLON1]MBT9429077.1 hypothetical protein [Candidatus Symbiopectobacterium endolongispinus]
MKLIDRKARKLAQSCVKNNPTRWGWTLAMWKLKQAYGIDEPEPMSMVGDVNSNCICTYSNPETGEYHFIAKRQLREAEGNYAIN